MVSYKALNTVCESLIPNTCHGIRNRDGGEADAPSESTTSNICHGIRNSDGGEAAAIPESTPSNTCHRIRNRDGGEAAAIPVFTTRCISINSPLNGRKVISWILLRENMMKI